MLADLLSLDEKDVILTCFGNNQFGQTSVPDSIMSDNQIVSIVESGDEHNCAMVSDKHSLHPTHDNILGNETRDDRQNSGSQQNTNLICWGDNH